MTDAVELSAEELALLAADEQEETATPQLEPEPVTEPEPKPKTRRTKSTSVDEAEAPAPATGNLNPEIPAQMTYDEGPWGLLPVQMRHDADGNPVG